ncbi:hypothetical protein MJO28_003853 [Puccinia striiformis f. sp. tritici]|uniref:FAD-binding PCMH-type domain-containing protein n=2 Tax=Puccinia striiformis TaxID=27350 RepID=A0A2S4UDW2_9BASI|nr:hypothetical protein Pst134EA_007528 [Puccinia striiformis f. sp. tritici]KAH9470264.1 hypothetical protein Pst134EA_007528 [Puccinia striiformis f. sp. tritici]KAI7956758.1 hypothetical protein MJO28_003853 [Puccinia striiformis f. sp. tritici]KAI7964041.1 hypothetical protein MJO29_004468 [Puccinia striiformis f. sp. tritici]POV95478.1 hypothetical protein PSHT_15643 [Puccinia striiformis]
MASILSSASISRKILASVGRKTCNGRKVTRRTLAGTAPLLGSTRTLNRPDHKTLAVEDVNQFRSILDSRPGAVISSLESDDQRTDPSDLEAFNVDWMGKYRGHSKVVLKPKSTEEVSRIVSYCAKNRLAICPQGGNTGLVGGSVPVFDEIILNLSALNKIRNFDQTSGIISVDAGCILQTADDFLKEKGFIFPLDLGAKGSCQVGGNIATNAGGLRLLRYGSLHGSVLGLEVVLPDQEGTILSSGMKTGLRKDNTGYDLKQLFIGSEGTLGVITGATILTPPRPAAVNVALIPVKDYTTIQKIFVLARQKLGEILSAFEFFDKQCFDLVLKHTQQKDPFTSSEDQNQFYVLIETSGSNKQHDDIKLEQLIESLMESETIDDGILSQDETQLQSIWSFRELIPESVGKHGPTYKYDLSVPLPVMYSIVEETRERFIKHGLLAPDGSEGDLLKGVVGFGHIGDGNLHLNVIAKKWDPKIEEVLEPWIYEKISSHNGSISAEHGLGLMKSPYLQYSQSNTNIQVMKSIKHLFDPLNILNPNKFLP